MTAAASRDFRHLTRHHVARSDPLAWLAASDLLLEQGDEEAARKWRRRGEWYPALREAVGLIVIGRATHASLEIAVGPFLVRFVMSYSRRAARLDRILAVVKWPDARLDWWGRARQFAFFTRSGERYLNRRTLELIDRLADIEARGAGR